VLAGLLDLDNKASGQLSEVFRLNKMGFPSEQTIFLAEHYFGSISFVICQKVFPNEAVPNRTTVLRLIKKFCETGSVCVCSPAVRGDDAL
jgi:hypothetical protein